MFFLVCKVMHCGIANHAKVSYLQCFLPVVEDGHQGKEDKSQFDSSMRESS